MGAVYLAERVGEFHQQVALKLMRPGLHSRMVVSRFRHERQILAGLDHPYIAHLLDGGATEDGRPYFVMEYVAGVPIDVWCARRGLSMAARLELFRKVCAAVEYAHGRLVVHRDIKPGNILVGEDGAPKLLDFGIAKLMGPAQANRTEALTEIGMRLMTPEYASPEQARGLAVTTATDVYSLGVVLYELLTGKMPYSLATTSAAEREKTICETEPPLPSAAQPDGRSARRLAGDLDNITLKALEKDPQRRYLSVEQLSEDIRRHLEGLPVTARPQTLIYRAGKFARRNRTAVAAAVLLVLSLAGGLVATAWQAHVAGIERARAERRFNDVRRLAESFLFQFDDQIRNLPGSTPARTLLVKQALTLLGSLAKEARGDTSLERELIEAYLRVGQVQGDPAFKNLGDSTGAAASYRQALGLAQDLVQRDPHGAEARRDLARAHRSLASVLWLRSDLAIVVSHFREGVAQLEAVNAATSPDLKLRSALSECYEELGDVLGNSDMPNLGDLKGARQAYEKGLHIEEGAVREHPKDIRSRAFVADFQRRIGDVQVDEGDAAGALRSYQSAAAVFDGLSAADPVNTALRSLVNYIHGKLGAAYEAVGQTEAARAEYARGPERQLQAMQADPADTAARLDYAEAVNSRAEREDKADRLPAALADYRQALNLLRPLHTADPENVALRSRCAHMLMMAGGALAKLHRESDARQSYGEGLAMQKKLADGPYATPDDIENYAKGLMDAPVKELLDPSAAVAYARRAVEMTKGERWLFLDRLAEAYSKVGDYANAAASEAKGLSLMGPSVARTTMEQRLTRFQAEARKPRP
jgi:non-specific serine/threonine protein kinase/serine/threonine-protein kinase